MIKEAINKLINKEELSEIELKEAFDEVFSGLADSVQGASFLSLLKQFDENVILSALNSSQNAIKKPFSIFNTDDLIQNISLNKNSKYLDISLIQDLICSSSDLNISKHFFKNSYKENNSLDILLNMGVNIEKDVDYTTIEYENLNFSYFYLSEDSPYFKYSEPIRKALPFDNILNLTHKLINPIGAKNLFLGVNNKEDVNKYANIALNLNKTNSIVVSGNEEFPYICPNGESQVSEAWKNKIFSYTITPELLGFKEADLSMLECENNKEQAQNILDIIRNKNIGAKFDIAIINSALSLYITKKADSLMDGIALVKKLIESGVVAQKFEQIKEFYS